MIGGGSELFDAPHPLSSSSSSIIITTVSTFFFFFFCSFSFILKFQLH